MPLNDGEIFAGFTIVRLLGSGGMGEVYLAQHPRLPRRNALKVLPADVSADPEYRARFIREADLVAALFHPHIVGVHDRGEYDHQLWISMDYIDGMDAAQFVRDRYPAGMPIDEVLAIVHRRRQRTRPRPPAWPDASRREARQYLALPPESRRSATHISSGLRNSTAFG